MSVEAAAKPTRRPFSKADRAILALHLLALVVVTVSGLIGANDPGWAALQRIVILMLAGIWAGGIALISVLSRLVDNQYARWAILLVGPLVGLVLIVVSQYLS